MKVKTTTIIAAIMIACTVQLATAVVEKANETQTTQAERYANMNEMLANDFSK